MYKPQKTKLSSESFTILNAIANDIGGDFKNAVPIVKETDDQREYGNIVMGNGTFREQFLNVLWNKIGLTLSFVRSYENPLARFKKGKLEVGEMVEQIWVELTMPEGYAPDVATPGDVYKVNKPDVRVAYSSVNSRLMYETTTNEDMLLSAFNTTAGLYNLVTNVVSRLTDSANYDEFIMTKYLMATAYLKAKPQTVPAVTPENANAIVTKMKAVSNALRFMDAEYNEAGVSTYTPIESQVFMLTADTSATLDVNSLAKAYNLDFVQFVGQQFMINGLNFTAKELERLEVMMEETAKQGIITGYKKFTTAEKNKLAKVVGATFDEDFLLIFDRLYQMNSKYDERHLNTNYFLHVWKVYTHNPFANCVFFATE